MPTHKTMSASMSRPMTFITHAFGALALVSVVACGSNPQQSGSGGFGFGGGDGDGDVAGDGDGDTTDEPNTDYMDHAGDGTPNPGEGGGPSPDENTDADGFSFSAEAGYYECDDGAPPGTGVTLPGGDGDGDNPGDGDGDNPGDGDGDNPGDGDGDGDNPGDGDGDGDGDGPGGQPICTDEVFLTATDTPARILLVVDKSGSMEDDAVGYPGSKWDGAVSALSDVVEATEDSIEYGLMRYPDGNANNNVCNEGALDVAVALGAANDIVNDLEGTTPGGGTPTAATLQEARQVLEALGDEGGTRAVVLATDGGPNCNASLNVNTCQCMVDGGCNDPRNCLDDTDAVAAAQALNNADFPVFVIGIPGSEDYTDVLNGLATAGGTAQPGATAYYDADDTDALAASLADIVTRVATCRFDLDFPPDPGSTTLSVNGGAIAHDPTRTNGWDLVDDNTVELFGTTCNLALGGNVQIDVGYCYTPEG